MGRMSQRWPLLHRRASGRESMTALRHTEIRIGAVKKHLTNGDRSSTGGEAEKARLGSTITSSQVFSSAIIENIGTMPCCLKQLGSAPYLGSGIGPGFRCVSPVCRDRLTLGLSSITRRHFRSQSTGVKNSRLEFGAVPNRLNKATRYSLEFRYLANARHVHIKHLRPFSFHGWPNFASCNALSWNIDSKSLVSISSPGTWVECFAPSRDDASVDENVSIRISSASGGTEEVMWKEATTPYNNSPDVVEHASETVIGPDFNWEDSTNGVSVEAVDTVSSEVQTEPTVIVFDIETTGFLRSGTKIVELACRDLAGGDHSTLETLVNPHQPVPVTSTAVHKITSEMVNRDDIPSWREVMPAFIDFVESRRKGNGQVILVAHNGRRFDVPFIMKECYECSMTIPSHWYFMDTIDLAKTMLKKRYGRTKLYNLQYLYYDCYNLPRLNDAHRAGVDVDMLASVFGKLLMDLELPVCALLDLAFKASDIDLKPDLLLREDNDRYTSSYKEGDEALLEQSMVELVVDKSNVDLAFREVGSTLERPDEGFQGTAAIAGDVESEKHWEFFTASVTLSEGFMVKNATTVLDENKQPLLKEEDFAAPLLTTATQLSGDEIIETSVGKTYTIIEGLDDVVEHVFTASINPGFKADHIAEAPVSAPTDEELLGLLRVTPYLKGDDIAEAPVSATTDEELLGLSRGTPAVESETHSSWTEKFVLESSQGSKEFEFEDALGLILGSNECSATNTCVPPAVSQVKDKTPMTKPLGSDDEASQEDMEASEGSERNDTGGSTMAPGRLEDHLRSSSELHEVRSMEGLRKDTSVDFYSLESAQDFRPVTLAVGDGTLQPLNLGGTLLKKKKGKRRGTGDVQTTATRNIAHTVADSEDQAATLESQDSNSIVPPVVEQDSLGSQHTTQNEKHRGVTEQLHTSSVNLSLLSPMMKQYVETKRQRPKFLLLSRVGDFYEAFFEDAERLAHACNIRLSGVDGGKLLERKVPMAGVPHHKVDFYLRTLLSKGIAVVKQDQITAADPKGGTIIDRQVTAVLTPGTLLDEGMLEESCNNFLVAIFPHADEGGTWGLAYSDISTGEFQATQGQGRSSLLHELLRLQPSEVIFPANVFCSADKKTGLLRPIGMPSGLCYSSRPTSEFFPAAAEKRLQASFGEDSLEAFVVLRWPHAIRAAGGLLGYVQETQKLSNEEIPLQKPSCYSTSDTMHMDDTVRNHLELLKTSRLGKVEGSLVWALDHTQTAMGGRLLRRWLLWPLVNREHICRRQDAVEVFMHNHNLRSQFRSELACISDIERVAARIAWKRADARDLLVLAQSIKSLPSLAALIEGVSANLYFAAASRAPTAPVQWASKVEYILAEDLGSGVQVGKVVKAGVDKVLDALRENVQESIIWLEEYEKEERLRTGVPSLEVGYNKNSGHFISIRKNKLKENCLPHDYQKLQSLKAEERFVTPLLLKCETARLAAEAKVCDREEELLRSLKEDLIFLLEDVRDYSQALAALDVLCTFADLAVKRDYSRPHMLETGREVTIVGGRHPVVELSLSEDLCFAPNSTYLGYETPLEKASSFEVNRSNEDLSEAEMKEELSGESENWWPRADLVLLTGPNASGKSCYLRQIGLIQLLAQAGSFVPAKYSRLSLADGLYTRVGAVDDLAAGQSTFRIEMVESANILNRATAHSLVLLDEVGRGTSSQEGGVIARAIIEFLSQKLRARTIFSTHYHNLHVLDQEYSNIANYYFQATELENGEVMFDHSVMPGYAVKSHAIAIGRGAGLPDWVCNRAAELLIIEEGSYVSVDDFRGHSDGVAVDRVSGVSKLNEDYGHSNVQDKKRDGLKDTSRSVEALASNGDLEDELLKGSSAMILDRLGEIESKVFESVVGQDTAAENIDKVESTPLVLDVLERSKAIEVEEQSSFLVQENSFNSSEASQRLEYKECDSSEAHGRSSSVQVEPSEKSRVKDGCIERWSTREQLHELWECVCTALHNQPATQALFRQKGSLASVKPLSEEVQVCVGASALFVRKFQQPEHFTALEAAFVSVLDQPVQLQIFAPSGAESLQK